jgi:magnesium transporter
MVSHDKLELLMRRLSEVVEVGQIDELKELLSHFSPYEYIEVLERLDLKIRSYILPYIPLNNLKVVLSKLPDDVIFELLRVKGIDEFAKVLTEMPSDDVADVLLKIPPKFRHKLMNLIPHWKLNEISALLKYPSESVGSIMTPQVPIFSYKLTVGDVIKEYIAKSELGLYDKHFYVYAVDEEKRIVGWVDVKTLISRPKDKLLRDVVSKPPVVVNVYSDREEVARVAIKFDLLEVPVVDNEGRLVGIVTLDDVLDVAISEYGEDLLRFGGFVETVRGRYLAVSSASIVKRRFLPLVWLYLMNTVTGGIVASFTGIIERVAVLAAFLPMLADNSGNVGAQASTFVIRSLAIGEVRPQDLLRVLKKEVSVSLLLVLLLSPISFSIASLITYLAYTNTDYSIIVGIVVSAALITSTLISDLVGALLPLIASRVNVDPASISAPLITTIGDIITATTYFMIATSLLSYLS